MVGHPFPKEIRLRRTKDFQRLRIQGQKRHTPHFVIYSFQRPDGPTRLGITVSRKVGGAVTRNRIKRFIREVFRLRYNEFPEHTDFSVIAKKHAGGISYDQVVRELLTVISCQGKVRPGPKKP